MASERARVLVELDAAELGPRRPVGALACERGRGESVISFSYEPGWVGANEAFTLDPSLPLYEGEQYPPRMPGIVSDAAPDRWGRTLLERREVQLARHQARELRRLDDWDFLVGVDDRTRMGALRLAGPGAGADAVLSDTSLPVPPLARLRELEHCAREAEERIGEELSEDERWLAMLIAPGSSLGGARPKANYLDQGSLWIAKFPSREDRYDVGACEYAISRLAAAAGVEVPETRLLSLGSAYRTFCTKRFDRRGDERRPYASAMTLAGREDNEDASYLDIARAIENLGDPAAIEADLRQLFRRVVFNVITADRDDHLRNHGFLRTASGWRLAPAFDVNPAPQKHEHSLALDDTVREPDLEVVRATAPLYRLSAAEAGGLIGEVGRAVAGWPQVARDAGLVGADIDRIGSTFIAA